VKKKVSSLSKVEQIQQLKKEAVAELLEKRQEIKGQLALEVAKFERLLEQNAKELVELGHRVKDSKVNLDRNVRLTDEQIRAGLEVILSGAKQLSLPSILQQLKIARSRFAEWEKRNPSVLEYNGNGKSRRYALKGGKKPKKH
jgi:hypothetical protein